MKVSIVYIFLLCVLLSKLAFGQEKVNSFNSNSDVKLKSKTPIQTIGDANTGSVMRGGWTVDALIGIAIPFEPSMTRAYSTSYAGTYTLRRKPSAAPWLRISYLSRSLVKNGNHDVRINTGLRLAASSSYREISYSGSLLPGTYDPFIPPLTESANIKEKTWSFSFMLESGVAYTLTLPSLNFIFMLNAGLGLNSYYVSSQKGTYNGEYINRQDSSFPRDIAPRSSESQGIDHLSYAVSIDLRIKPTMLKGFYLLVNFPLWNELMNNQARGNGYCPCGTREIPTYQPSIGFGYNINRSVR
jgi:hypothetical protein